MHNYSHFVEHPLALDARMAIYSRAAASEIGLRTTGVPYIFAEQYVSSDGE